MHTKAIFVPLGLMLSACGSDLDTSIFDRCDPACAVCGNGRIEAGETCDDGQAQSGDGCSAACSLEPDFSCCGEPSVCAPSATRLDTNLLHTCAVTAGALACWGQNNIFESSEWILGNFVSAAAGSTYNCGVACDGAVVCSGESARGAHRPPAGSFTVVSAGLKIGFGAGSEHACGVRQDNTVACWGQNADGQTNAPAGAFKSVSAGGFHACGSRDSGQIVCWGHNAYGQCNPPNGL